MEKNNNVAKTFGDNLKRIRTEKGISRKEIAEIIGVNVDTFGKYETGKILPPLDKIFEIADYLKVSVVSITGVNYFSDSIPNIDKVVDEKIFEYRFERALKIANDADLNPVEFKGEIFINITKETKLIKENGTSEIVPLASVFSIKSRGSFIEIIERAETRAIKMDITFWESFKYLCGI